jgi:heat shock protein HslJ
MRRTIVGSTLVAALGFAAGCAPYGAGAVGAGSGGAIALEGTAWSLVEIGGRPARATSNAGTPTLRLDGAQRATGDTGCNSFAGPYELSGGSLRFGALVSTRRACIDEGLNRQESAYLRALEDTRSWRIAGASLVLSGDAGVAARFEAQR